MNPDADYRLGHFLLGIEGLALLRGADADDAMRFARLDEISSIVAGIDAEPFSASRAAAPVPVVTGYGEWAATYDTPGNVTVELEQEIVWRLLDKLPGPSVVLDAACGTGRHAVRLAEAGHHVIGVDSSGPMLELARAKLPDGVFHKADLIDMPLEDGSVDYAVCALALSHASDMRPGVAELARVLRPGGRLIVSNPHPFATSYLNWRATVATAAGGLALIPEYPHSHAASISAFREAGMEVLECHEAALSADQAADEAKAGLTDAFRAALTGVPVVVVWVLERR